MLLQLIKTLASKYGASAFGLIVLLVVWQVIAAPQLLAAQSTAAANAQATQNLQLSTAAAERICSMLAHELQAQRGQEHAGRSCSWENAQ